MEVHRFVRLPLRMTLREVVAKNLRRLRHARGLSQEELADLAGVNRNYVGMLEREEHSATLDMLDKLARALRIEATELFDRTKRSSARHRRD